MTSATACLGQEYLKEAIYVDEMVRWQVHHTAMLVGKVVRFQHAVNLLYPIAQRGTDIDLALTTASACRLAIIVCYEK